jgi:hypothetical protein
MDERWQRMLAWRDEQESKLSPTSKALPRPPEPDRKFREFRKALAEDEEKSKFNSNLSYIDNSFESNQLQNKLDKIATDYNIKDIHEKERIERERMKRERMERERMEREQSTIDAFSKMAMVDQEYRDMVNMDEYLQSIKPESTLEKNRKMLEELEEYKQSQIEEYVKIRDSDIDDETKKIQMNNVLKNAESTQEQINLIMSLNQELESKLMKIGGRRSVPLNRNKRTINNRKALSDNNKPRYDHSALHPLPRENESRIRFNNRMRRRRNARELPRMINYNRLERDLGDYPDEPQFGGNYKYMNKGGTIRKVNSATYKRNKNKNRRKSIRSDGSSPMLNLRNIEEYKWRKNDNRKKFMTRLKRRRNSSRLIGNDTRKDLRKNPEIYNENRPLREAKMRLSKSKVYLDKKSVKKPTKLSELPHDILEKINEL